MPGASSTALRVGTTGDYAPFTRFDPDTLRYDGIDIERVETFARARGFAVAWVRTTWADLLVDLLGGHFQMAAGGIAKTAARAEAALMSDTLDHMGKVALVRCGEEGRYASLAQIDGPSVRVVENDGGTNERFAEANIKHARIITLPDNHQPFAYLKAGKADVMFTDSIEAAYLEAQHEGLCAVRPDKPLTRIETVFLFRQDAVSLRDDFNRWLVGVPCSHRPMAGP